MEQMQDKWPWTAQLKGRSVRAHSFDYNSLFVYYFQVKHPLVMLDTPNEGVWDRIANQFQPQNKGNSFHLWTLEGAMSKLRGELCLSSTD